MTLPTYIVRWRVAAAGGDVIARWRSIPRCGTPRAREAILAACRGAVGGEARISIVGDDATAVAVMTSRKEILRWDPAEAALPAPVDGEWGRELALGDRRSALARAVRALMRDAVDAKLVSLEQGAAIASSVRRAIEGPGPA